jgi:hypothetical protein
VTGKQQTLDEWIADIVNPHARNLAITAAARAFEEAGQRRSEVNARVRADIYGEQALMGIAQRLLARAAELRKGEG